MFDIRVVALGLGAMLAIARGQAPDTSAEAFHHVHLSAPIPADTAQFYKRLFTRVPRSSRLFDGPAIEYDGVFLALSAGSYKREPPVNRFWHMGWGDTSLDQSYRSHLVNQVEWNAPPYLTWKWHLHVLSRLPKTEARWFAERFAGKLLVSEAEEGSGANFMSLALVRWPHISLVFHSWDGTDPEDRVDYRIDHVAFAVADVRKEAAGLKVLSEHVLEDGTPTALGLAPDGLVVELVQRDRR